ncbi:Uncharacterized protein GBIM_08016 [Gryllus bimaculatus]|nr:Uncharacterized protein GBIM_08016 [Gryllus bimaculatus]
MARKFPGLNVKLEKSNSEPNVFDGSPSKLNNCNSSKSNSNQVSPSVNTAPFEDSLAGVSSANNAESLFLSFQEGDLFQVLSKEEHKNWWAVRSIKQNTVGFVPANYMQLPEIIRRVGWALFPSPPAGNGAFTHAASLF